MSICVYAVECDIVVKTDCPWESRHARMHRYLPHLPESTSAGDVWACLSIGWWQESLDSYHQGRHYKVFTAVSRSTVLYNSRQRDGVAPLPLFLPFSPFIPSFPLLFLGSELLVGLAVVTTCCQEIGIFCLPPCRMDPKVLLVAGPIQIQWGGLGSADVQADCGQQTNLQRLKSLKAHA